MEYKDTRWIFSKTEISLGGSSVLGNNYILFYFIHIVAITIICISLACSVALIHSVVKQVRKKNNGPNRTEFSDRFPLYMALTYIIFGLSHISDHLLLFITEKFPGRTVSVLLGINLFISLGYLQLMHAGLAGYSYLKIVRRKNLILGSYEWKLHLACLAIVLSTVVVVYPFDAFGPTGYWMFQNVHTAGGAALNVLCVISTTCLACFTSFGYHEIRKMVEKGNNNLNSEAMDQRNWHSTASECLATYVFVSLVYYWPSAVTGVLHLVEVYGFGAISPLTSIAVVVAGNSIGWINTAAYFYNLRVKRRRELARALLIRINSATDSAMCYRSN